MCCHAFQAFAFLCQLGALGVFHRCCAVYLYGYLRSCFGFGLLGSFQTRPVSFWILHASHPWFYHRLLICFTCLWRFSRKEDCER